MAKMYYEEGLRPQLSLDGKKIAIIGYGSQGHAHALNLQRLRLRRHRRPAQGRQELGQVAEKDGFTCHDRRRGRQGGRHHHDPHQR